MATRKSKFDRILQDPLRKNLGQIAFELAIYSIKERRFAKEYLSRLLYRKNSLPFNHFLRDEEIGKLDEAMILFHMRGHEIGLFEGDRTNFKVTRPSDIKIANAMLRG